MDVLYDMINYAYDVDVFTIWADMLVHNKCFYDINRKYLVGYTSRRNNIDYLHSMDEVYEKYGDKIVANMDIPKYLLMPWVTMYCFLELNQKMRFLK